MVAIVATVAAAFGAWSPAQAQQICHNYVVYTGCTNITGACVSGYGRVGGTGHHTYRLPCPAQ
jgi:hypothetical protein